MATAKLMRCPLKRASQKEDLWPGSLNCSWLFINHEYWTPTQAINISLEVDYRY
ncbi:MAG: hypothetical protein ACLTHL_03020 [Collinsella sp.]